MRHANLSLAVLLALGTTFGCASGATQIDRFEPPVQIEGNEGPAGSDVLLATGVTGEVKLKAIIDEDGRVTKVKVLRSDDELLIAWALETVATWRFRPATINGKPVAVNYNLTLNLLAEP